MNKEILRMQMLAGIITEGQYKSKLNEEKYTLRIIFHRMSWFLFIKILMRQLIAS